MTDAQLKSLEGAACPGAGACGGQFTANTMALVCEFLGIAPMDSPASLRPTPQRAMPVIALVNWFWIFSVATPRRRES